MIIMKCVFPQNGNCIINDNGVCHKQLSNNTDAICTLSLIKYQHDKKADISFLATKQKIMS